MKPTTIIILWLIFVSIPCSIWGYKLSKRKSKAGVFLFFIGLSIIGMIWGLLLYIDAPKPEPDENEKPQQIVCCDVVVIPDPWSGIADCLICGMSYKNEDNFKETKSIECEDQLKQEIKICCDQEMMNFKDGYNKNQWFCEICYKRVNYKNEELK